MLFSTILFIGCSTDVNEDSFNDSYSSRLSDDNLNSKAVIRPFKSKAFGDWYFVESIECNGLLQYSIMGTGNATHMGAINIEGTICTFPPDQYFLSGKYIAANGDELFWESTEVFFDELGLFAGGVFQFLGGTGRFSSAVGTFTINETIKVDEFDQVYGFPLSGTFSNKGSGSIAY